MRPVYGPGESVVARIDAAGMVMLGEAPGPVIGCIRGIEIYGDAYGATRLGHVDGDGHIFDSYHAKVGRVDASLIVYDKNDARVGRVIESVDSGVLLLVIGAQQPDALRPTLLPETASGTVMDEVNAVESLMKRTELRGRKGEF